MQIEAKCRKKFFRHERVCQVEYHTRKSTHLNEKLKSVGEAQFIPSSLAKEIIFMSNDGNMMIKKHHGPWRTELT